MNDATAASIVRFRAIDTRDWDVVRGLLADEVVLDYTSVFAGWYHLSLAATDPPRVAGIVLTADYETGSRDLVARAQERAAG